MPRNGEEQTSNNFGGKRHMRRFITLAMVGLLLASTSACKKVTDTEAAVAESMWTGSIRPEPVLQGLRWEPFTNYSTYTTREIQFPAESESEVLSALTSDQLAVGIDAALRYRINADRVVSIYKEIGSPAQVHEFVYNTYRSAGRDAVAEISAQSLLSTERSGIGVRIEELMNEKLSPRGIELTQFFVRGIVPPAPIRQAIEQKLAREQQVAAERYQTEVIQEQANQRREEAKGIRDAQTIIAQSLTDNYLRYETIKALNAAAMGENNLVVGVPGANILLNPNQ